MTVTVEAAAAAEEGNGCEFFFLIPRVPPRKVLLVDNVANATRRCSHELFSLRQATA